MRVIRHDVFILLTLITPLLTVSPSSENMIVHAVSTTYGYDTSFHQAAERKLSNCTRFVLPSFLPKINRQRWINMCDCDRELLARKAQKGKGTKSNFQLNITVLHIPNNGVTALNAGLNLSTAVEEPSTLGCRIACSTFPVYSSIRDPVTRFVSTINFLHHGSELSTYNTRGHGRKFVEGNVKQRRTFSHFLRRLVKHPERIEVSDIDRFALAWNFSAVNKHFLPQHTWIYHATTKEYVVDTFLCFPRLQEAVKREFGVFFTHKSTSVRIPTSYHKNIKRLARKIYQADYLHLSRIMSMESITGMELMEYEYEYYGV